MNAYFLIIALLGVTGFLLAPTIAKYAARRSSKQKVLFDTNAEEEVLAYVLQDPGAYVFVHELTPEAFVKDDHKVIWETLKAAAVDVELPETGKEKNLKKLEALHETAAQKVRPDLFDAKLAKLSPELAVTAENLKSKEVSKGREPLLQAGGKVWNTFEDRTTYNGLSIIEKDPTNPDKLVRSYREPSKGRLWVSRLLLASVFALIPAMSAVSFETFSFPWILATLSLIVLAGASLVWALVDIDTLYLDDRSFLIGGGLAWALTVATIAVTGNWVNLLIGVGYTIIVGVVFEVLNFVARRLRGVDGIGFGDTIIVLATAGIPATLAGSFLAGHLSILCAMLTGIVAFVIFKIIGRGKDRKTPFALGPYLALGWVVAYLLLVFVGEVAIMDFIDSLSAGLAEIIINILGIGN